MAATVTSLLAGHRMWKYHTLHAEHFKNVKH